MKKVFFLLLIFATTLFSGCKKKLNCGEVAVPVVISNSPVEEQDTLKLYASSTESELSYVWTGPNGFSSSEQNPVLNAVGFEAAGIYKLQMFSGSCPAPEVSVEVSIIPASPPCSPANNTLNFNNCFFDQTYTSCIGSSSSGQYKLSAGNISSDIDLTFNTVTEAPPGLYNIEAYPCNNCGPGYVGLRLLVSGSILSTPQGGKLYLQKIGGKITATFCSLTVSHGGCSASVTGRLKAN
ncbi:MAG: hypothetical protein ABI723_15050 [Bacteroidia bacterium]